MNRMLLSSIPNFFGFGLSESSTEVSLVSVACARYRRDRVHSPRSPVRYQSPQICNAGNPVCGRVSTGPSVPVVDVRPCFIYSRVSDALELTSTSCIACLSLSTSLHDCDMTTTTGGVSQRTADSVRRYRTHMFYLDEHTTSSPKQVSPRYWGQPE